ncbi:MAG: hypothetical protein AAF957_02350 [Planctomycetota bacterium]
MSAPILRLVAPLSVALSVALLLAASAAAGPSLQGPDTGSPFVDAPLPIDALKAPPESAFQVLLLSFGVFLLVPIGAAAFLALARLRNLEETLAKELRAVREAVATGDGESEDEETLSLESATERLERALGAVRASVEGAAERAEASAAEARSAPAAVAPEAPDMDRIVEALDRANEAQVEATRETVARLDALAKALQDVAVLATAASAASAGLEIDAASDPRVPPEGRVATALDHVHERLSAMGYTDVRIVTEADLITAELVRSGELLIEARRGGGVHKGRVVLEDGRVIDVRLQPGHGMFP